MAKLKISKSFAYVIFFATLTLSGRIGSFIVTPPWLDAFRDDPTWYLDIENTTGINETETVINGTNILPADIVGHQSSVFFIIFGQFSMTAFVFGIGLLIMKLVSPNQLIGAQKKYSQKSIFISGFCQGLSAWLFNFSLSGTRTPPYLQALLANFGIPIQFAVRYAVLRKPSTRLKVVCAGVVMLSEFISFIPSIFPGIESAAQHKEDGGTTGPGRIIWPMVIVISQIPYAVANSLMEEGVQEEKKKSTIDSTAEDQQGLIQADKETNGDQNEALIQVEPNKEDETKVNILYFSFWWSFYCSITIGLFFWADLIPHVGTTSSIHVLGKTLIFNAKCLFGQAGCGPQVYILGWANYLSLIFGTLGYTGLMRYSDGANFVLIFLSLRTPSVFLIWTLCDEHPLVWHPHVTVATWLSIVSVTFMLPAIIIYHTGLPERLKLIRWCNRSSEDQDNLIINADETENQGHLSDLDG